MALEAIAGGAGAGTAAGPGYGTLIGAGIGALGSLAGGIIGAKAADAASARQARALEAALAFQRQRYAEAQTNLNPYINTGTQALGDYAGLVQGMAQPEYTYQQKPFEFSIGSDPGAQYAMQQAAQAINASSIARGAVGGGAAKSLQSAIQNKARESFGQGFDRWKSESEMRRTQADNAYNRANQYQLDRIKATGAVAGAGQSAAENLAGTGTHASTNIGNTLGSLGSAQAAGAAGYGNALAQGISGLASGLGSGISQRAGQQDAESWIRKLLAPGVSGGVASPDFGNA